MAMSGSMRRRVIICGAAGALIAFLASFVAVDRSIVHRYQERQSYQPSNARAEAFRVSPGEVLDAGALERELASLSYREVGSRPRRPGEYERWRGDWLIYLHAAMTPDGRRASFPVRLDVSWGGRVREVTNELTGRRLEAFTLEAPALFTFYEDRMEDRRRVSLEEVPPGLLQGVLLVEDRRFYSHHGIDPVGIGRAVRANLRAGQVLQGGSTITQQLAKNLLGPSGRTWGRKFLEAEAAVALELHYSKEEILAGYLNEVYLGQRGPVAVTGIQAASLYFFGVPARELDTVRSALLAGMIRNPGRFNPRLHPEEARARRNVVLHAMHDAGLLSDKELDASLAAPLGVIKSSPAEPTHPWMEDYLKHEFASIDADVAPAESGCTIFTTFDARIQAAAQKALDRGLKRLERARGNGPLEGAVVVLRPADGAILALVGGRDFRRSQYDRALLARRSPGSTFKPFVYLAGFERALQEDGFRFSASTMLEDVPFEVPAGGKMWSPANYDGEYRGSITVRDALEQSVNVATVRAAMYIGLDRVVEAAHRCGIESDLQPVPSLALGAEEVTPLELAAAYAPFANGGWRVRPHAVTAIVDGRGRPLDLPERLPERVIDEATAYVMTSILQGVLESGTARSARGLGYQGNAGGKTGTSGDLRDAWFVGYTPGILALVWVGADDNHSIGMTGSSSALPIWVDLMNAVGANGDAIFPHPPEGIVHALIDPSTGQLATRSCPQVRDEVFTAGSEPHETCAVHPREGRGLFHRLFSFL